MPTTTPEVTLDRVGAFFQPFVQSGQLAAIGVASFGPLDLQTMTIASTTPKVSWRGLNWRYALHSRLGDLRLTVETDTNAAIIAETNSGAAVGVDVAAYVTVGTGIGGAIFVGGSPLHGIGHPEIGHVLVGRAPGDTHLGICTFHENCLEGFASGSALVERYGVPATLLPANHKGLELEAHYLAAACVNLILTVGAERIVLGGGVLDTKGLRRQVSEKAAQLLNGYLPQQEVNGLAVSVIVAPKFIHSGLVGAWLLAPRNARDLARSVNVVVGKFHGSRHR